MSKAKPPASEASCYAIEAVWQIVPDVKCREDGNVLLSPLQCETLLRRFGWKPISESRPTPRGGPAVPFSHDDVMAVLARAASEIWASMRMNGRPDSPVWSPSL